ncbi:hypothetical protein GALMADRAFT_146496 [Galerina marginata CBS 339.88]|uniref:Uncharacterized protein n=1 Tax=Galerina marginata (strain CBS 339.88) TaxID=685588 RepID=A0A067SBG7_GALM3|nr:hypothetical protein GALMADRAFT_146496 [Galerina marginata CBS 339.88]
MDGGRERGPKKRAGDAREPARASAAPSARQQRQQRQLPTPTLAPFQLLPLLLPFPTCPTHRTRERDEDSASAVAPAAHVYTNTYTAGPAAVLRPARACFASGAEAGREAAAARSAPGALTGKTPETLGGEREGGCCSEECCDDGDE